MNALPASKPINVRHIETPASGFKYLEYSNEMTEAAAGFDSDMGRISHVSCSNYKKKLFHILKLIYMENAALV